MPVNFPKPPNVATAENARHVTLEQLLHWYFAPRNPARLAEAGATFALTSHGLDNPKSLLAQVGKAVRHGLPADTALAALTSVPAKMLGIDDRYGAIKPGMSASLVVTDGDLFEKGTKVHSVWVDGREFTLQERPSVDVRGTWQVRLSQPVNRRRLLTLTLTGTAKKPSGKLEFTTANEDDDPSSASLDHLTLQDSRLLADIDAEMLGETGRAMLSLLIVAPQGTTERLSGSLQLPSGKRVDVTATLESGPSSEPDEDDAKSPPNEEDEDTEAKDEKKPSMPTVDAAVVNYPLGGFGRTSPPDAPDWVAYTNATVWTCGPEGVLKNATVLVHKGLVSQVAAAADVVIPEGAVEVDCQGRHISPGIIDCHSHMATDGGVNESSQAITAEVRIGDFIDSDDITIYRQLAGGVTAANILHGSANPIGGQNQVIKLRWGALPEAMKMPAAPAGIKFALGENVKQSNWGDDFTSRYPQTRMGVEQIIRDAFHAAVEYDRRWQEWRREHRGLPPRRDLELEALAEIVRGERWIHCHSYRQDEILALLRTLEDFDITIGSLQHILEGYKVAPEMAAHGATGSSFSDWWAYKFEVYDAIPYNGALMHEAGIAVSFNSDDRN